MDIQGITSNEPVQHVKENYNILDDISYRLIYKEDKDMVDFTIISLIISLMLVVIIILNKRKYTIKI